MKRKRAIKRFENNKNVGSYTDIIFKITHDTDMGPESIEFETKIHYMDKGEGEPLLLIHGIGQSLYTWRRSIDFFAEKGYRVLALDLAGFGYSGHPHIYYTVEENALIIKAFMDSLKIKKAHIAAFSTSCLSSICLAHAYPERVGKMILVSPGGPNENYLFSLKFLTTRIGHALSRFIITEAAARNILHDLFFDATIISSDDVKQYYAPFNNNDTRETLAMYMMHFDDTYTRSLLKGVKHETLIFSGADDKIHNEKIMKPYIKTIPRAKHIRFRNCAHFVHEEKPHKYNEEALAFLKQSERDY